MSCVFCDIVADTSLANCIEEWPEALAFVPLNPVIGGHLLVIPKVHVQDFTTDELVTASVFARAAQLAQESGDEEGLNLITSAGVAATQSVFHMHVHLIPRYATDRLSLPWDVRVDESEAGS